MARLSTSALRRIGQAVRAAEATAGKGPRVLADVPTIHARWAKVMSVVEGSPGAGEPYVYAADIYTGRYDETPAERTPIAEDAELWSHIALSVDDWLGVVRVGGHWEVFGAGGGDTFPTASTAGQIIQWVALETVSGSTVAAHWEAVELGTLTDKSLLVWNGTSKRWTAQVPITSELVADIRYNTTDHCLEKKVVKGIVLTSATNSTSFTTISNGTFVAFPGTATT